MRDRSEEQPAHEAPDAAGASAGERAPAEPPAGGAPQESAGPAQELAAELEALRDRYLRTAAEYENYRRRSERERSEAGVRAQAELVERLLDPLDDLQRVTQYGTETATVDGVLEGVELVERKLFRVLEGAGLEVIDPRGQPFDPTLHDALMTTPTEAREEDDHVAEVFQRGYQFQGILLRPARVQVKKYGG